MITSQAFMHLAHPIQNPSTMATNAREEFPDTISALGSIMRHPRSLSRPRATWRPPVKKLPALITNHPLNASLTRHRTGIAVRRRLWALGKSRVAAYVMIMRITSPTGTRVNPGVAEGWVRAFVGEEHIECVHELPQESAPTYVWVVDASFTPVKSPAELFTGEHQAA